MMIKPLLLFLFLTTNVVCFSQSEKIKKHEIDDGSIDRKGILFGAHLSKYPTLEIGYSKYFHSPENTKMPFAGGYAISVENYFVEDYILAPKLSYWANFLFLNLGVSIPWYTDLKGGNSLKIRPEIGFGEKNWRVNFAYNIPTYNNGLNHITQTMLSFNYIIPISKAE